VHSVQLIYGNFITGNKEALIRKDKMVHHLGRRQCSILKSSTPVNDTILAIQKVIIIHFFLLGGHFAKMRSLQSFQ
jgi:hypothetical protein